MSATYIIIEENDSTVLIQKINAMLVAGWKVQGGIAYNPQKNLYLQSMIMYFDGEGETPAGTSTNIPVK